jgi:hypothetical protein
MKNIQSDLNEQLLQQDFVPETEQLQLEQCQIMAQNFVELENGIAILRTSRTIKAISIRQNGR